MKTLQEILDEKDKNMKRSFTPNGTFYDFQIIDAVKEFLSQYEIEEPKFTNDYYNNQIIDEMIKDLTVSQEQTKKELSK